MNTTLNKIRAKHPCEEGREKLLNTLGKTKADDEPVSLKTILESNGIEDAIWCLRCFDYLDVCLFSADVAESVLHMFEAKYPDDDRPRKAIEGIRKYKNKEIDSDALSKLQVGAYDAADAAADAAVVNAAAAYAAYAADAADAAAAYAAVNAAVNAAYAYAVYAADAADAAADAREKQWAKIEALFIEHFCSDEEQ